ncbi:MAG: M2 family metallopeptidase [Deltaproteobacteria bacterium]|nr:M2 family metallopeptidase [Deltaproteobacteria bacterium]
MRNLTLTLLCALLALSAGCKEKPKTEPSTEPKAAVEPVADTGVAVQTADAKAFLDAYQKDFSELERVQTSSYWKAANSGQKADFDAYAKADLALKKLHSDPGRYAEIKRLLASGKDHPALTRRALEVAKLAFEGNQLPADLLEKMVAQSTEIERLFNTFRAELDGEKLSNNDLLERLSKSNDSTERKRIWEALKAAGAAVAPKLVALAELRNQAAAKLGYKDFWYMRIALQEHDPDRLLALFDKLDELTAGPFKAMKAELDAELAKRFGIQVAQMRPWHYDNPFFQEPPPSDAIDLDVFYKDKTKEDIVALGKAFYADIGLPADDIIARSDFFEREGKDQHAFCITIDRAADVRMLLNIKPTASWMDTMLHETGHAVYYEWTDRALPFNLREAAHIFTTEAVAMLFGALAKNPRWMIDYAGADESKVREKAKAILEQRRREQLIFARWAMVMLHFEKALYENPKRDLNKLWYDTVERYQMLTRPEGRDAPDWAAKPHFTIAPVYYHNYLLGEVFAAQLRAALVTLAGHEGPPCELSYKGRKDFGRFFKEKIFAPGMRQSWPAFVEQATGSALSPDAFASELKPRAE